MKEKQHSLQIRIVNPDLYAATVQSVKYLVVLPYYRGFVGSVEINTVCGTKIKSPEITLDEFEQDYGFIFEN